MRWELFAAGAAEALEARKAFRAFLIDECTPGSDCRAAEIAFGELVTNAIRYAPGPITIALSCGRNGVVVLDVSDTGPDFNFKPCLPTPESESGRGLYIVSRLCAHVCKTRTDRGNKVSAVLPVLFQNGERAHLEMA